MTGPYLGKFRGIVTDIEDPVMTGRIRARVPDVYGEDESGWAAPCLPFGGQGVGFYALPTTGAGVWIEFEHGDADYPIWSGCWIGSAADVPSSLLAPPYKKVIVVTSSGHSIILDDTPGVGGITLKTADGAKLEMSSLGITIENGKGASIKMTGAKVSVNSGALDVT